jgi:hypothetical protein
MNESLSTRELIFKLVEEYVESADRLAALAAKA